MADYEVNAQSGEIPDIKAVMDPIPVSFTCILPLVGVGQ